MKTPKQDRCVRLGITMPASLAGRLDVELALLRRANPGKVLSKSMLIQHVLSEMLPPTDAPRRRRRVAEARSAA